MDDRKAIERKLSTAKSSHLEEKLQKDYSKKGKHSFAEDLATEAVKKRT